MSATTPERRDHLACERPIVSVLVVTWNSAAEISVCLDSIFRHTNAAQLDVIVVDNGSTDDTPRIVRLYGNQVRLVDTGANLGFARAANLALALSVGDYILLLNPDTRFENDVIGTLVRFLDERPDAGAAGPRIVDSDGRLAQFAARRFPSASVTLATELGLRRLFPRALWMGRGGSVIDPDWQTPAAVPCLTGAALMVRRVTFDRVGGLDDSMPMYFEDLDMCARIEGGGSSLYYVPEAVLLHRGARSTELSPFRGVLRAAEFGHAPWLYLRRYRGHWDAGLFTVAIAAGSIFRLVLAQIALWVPKQLSPELRLAARRQATRSASLLRWALTSQRTFERRLCAGFASDDVWWRVRGQVTAAARSGALGTESYSQ